MTSNKGKWISASALFVASVAVTAGCAVSGTESESVSPSKPTSSHSVPQQEQAGKSAMEVEYEGLSASTKNAVDSTLDYLTYFYKSGGTSKSGLVEQLEYEGYGQITATSAVEFAEKHAEIDWDLMATVSATSYLEMGGFSKSGLVEQLKYEGYTSAQAEQGVNAAY